MIDLSMLPGKAEESADVAQVVRELELFEVMDAPPDCKYLVSRPNGINLLLEEDVVSAVQIHVEAKGRHAAFACELPLGLKGGMLGTDVQAVLGTPNKQDSIDYQYRLESKGIRLIVVFGGTPIVRYLSIECL